jgi:hypothetical protein
MFIIFSVFENSYVFIPQFFSRPLKAFCGTLFEEHWFRASIYTLNE